MDEYRTACFVLTGIKNGEPLPKVDDKIREMQREDWDFVQLTSSSTAAALSVVVVFRRPALT
jgi:hypothetical protein